MKTGPLRWPSYPATNGPRSAHEAVLQQQEQCFRLHPACQMCARHVQTHRNMQSGDRTGNISVLIAAVGGNKKALFRLNVHFLRYLIILAAARWL